MACCGTGSTWPSHIVGSLLLQHGVWVTWRVARALYLQSEPAFGDCQPRSTSTFTPSPVSPPPLPRAGGHNITRAALHVFGWALLTSLLAELRALLAPESAFSASLSEKGTLQLLFDVRFLRDMLSGALPVMDANRGQLYGLGEGGQPGAR